MKNKRKTQNVYSGIKITDNISLTIPKRKFLPDFVPLLVIAFFGCIGIVNAFVTMFHIDISSFIFNFYTVFFFMIFSVIFILPKKMTTLLIPIIFIYEFLLYRKWENYINGFMLVCNQTYRTIFPRRSDYFRLDMSEINPDSDIKIFICFTVFILTALICYVSIVRPNFFFGFLFTFPLIEIGLYYGKSPDLLPVLMLVVYWAALLAVHQSGYCRNSGRSKTGFIRKGNTFISKPAIRFRTAGQSGIIMLLSSAAIMTAVFVIINISGYSRSDKLNTMRSNVKTAVSEFTLDDISGSLERLSASFGIGGLKTYNHRLGNLNSVSYSGRTELTIKSSGFPIPHDNVYLKGYVGSVYDGKSWSELDQKVYEKNSALFDGFRENQLYPQDMLFDSYGKDMEMLSSVYPSLIDMTVEPSFFNRQYCFTPYNSRAKDELSYINDIRTESKNKNKYSFEVSPYQDYDVLLTSDFYSTVAYYSNDSVVSDNNDESESSSDSEYRDFVYSNYLDVPNNEETQKLYNIFIDGNISDDVFTQLNYIENVLEENAQYTLEPGRTPAGKDFVSYFLTENHKGYCVHFATAGVILARMSGIPARFAEGYVVLADDFNESNETENGYKIEIKDERAHAWAEIYIDGYGWIPYEFTPAAAPALNPSGTDEATKTTTAALTKPAESNSQTSRSTRTSSDSSQTSIKTTGGKNNSGSGTKISRKAEIFRLSPEAKLILVSVFTLVLIIAIIAAVHCITLKRRENSFKTESNSQNALNAYRYILKLLEFCDVKKQNMQYLEFAEYVQQNTRHIFRNDELTEITEIALEAGLSGHEITAEQSDKVIKLSYKTARAIFVQQNIFERFYMKFIKNLI